MPRKPKKPHWSAGKNFYPGLTGGTPHPPPAPMPPPSGPAATLTTGMMVPPEPEPELQLECGRCRNIREGLPPPAIAPDHSPRCPWRGTGKDPAVG